MPAGYTSRGNSSFFWYSVQLQANLSNTPVVGTGHYNVFDLRHPHVLPEISENAINSTSNTSTFINWSRLHVSTLIGSSSDLLFKTSLQNARSILKTSFKQKA